MKLFESLPERDEKWSGRGFMLPAAIFISIALICSAIFPREDIHIFINNFHTEYLDALMKGWTFLGDGAYVLIIIALFLFIRLRFFFIVFSSYAISGILSQILKRTLFSGIPRPVKYFELNNIEYNLYLVPGVDIHSWYSFPSGHTATAFGVFFGISLFLRSELLQLLCFVAAAGVGYSRIYLSEHFLVDVAGGAIIGMASAILSYWWLRRYRTSWMDKPVHRI